MKRKYDFINEEKYGLDLKGLMRYVNSGEDVKDANIFHKTFKENLMHINLPQKDHILLKTIASGEKQRIFLNDRHMLPISLLEHWESLKVLEIDNEEELKDLYVHSDGHIYKHVNDNIERLPIEDARYKIGYEKLYGPIVYTDLWSYDEREPNENFREEYINGTKKDHLVQDFNFKIGTPIIRTNVWVKKFQTIFMNFDEDDLSLIISERFCIARKERNFSSKSINVNEVFTIKDLKTNKLLEPVELFKHTDKGPISTDSYVYDMRFELEDEYDGRVYKRSINFTQLKLEEEFSTISELETLYKDKIHRMLHYLGYESEYDKYVRNENNPQTNKELPLYKFAKNLQAKAKTIGYRRKHEEYDFENMNTLHELNKNDTHTKGEIKELKEEPKYPPLF
jgi:hypothetical protein